MLACNSLAHLSPAAMAPRRMFGTIYRVHAAGLPSPGIGNGTNDFFGGPIMSTRATGTLLTRFPATPGCPRTNNSMGLTTN